MEVTMTRQQRMRIVLGVVLAGFASHPFTALGAAAQFASTAAAAVKGSPELVNALSKEMGSTPEQAAGAAGALFGLAKTRLTSDQFAQVAQAVPGMDTLLSAAPPTGTSGAGGIGGALSSIPGGAGLGSATTAFSKLGLKPDMVGKAIPVLTSFVGKSGGSEAANLLAGALK
jgi:hypothetical protein